MLTHTTLGNYVVHMTPGCNVPTVDCMCTTPQQAASEADRLNTVQIERDKAAKHERALLDRFAMSNDLGGVL